MDWSSKWALYSPDKIAFKEYETGRTLTFGELNRLGNRLAHHLVSVFKVKRGDRVAVLGENCLEYLILFAAAQKTGCILVPLNYRLSGAEIDYLLLDAQPRLVIGESKFQHLLDAAPYYSKLRRRWSLEDLAAFCDKAISTDFDGFFPEAIIRENDPVFILYTSGTTGFPKGALYTHKMMFWNSINTAMSLIVNTESRTVNVMPPFHTGGWNVLTTPFFHHGGYTCLMKKFEPAAVLQLLQSEQCTLFMGVPTMLKMLADEPGFEQADFSSLLYIIVGGEPMPVPLIEKWHEKGVLIRQGYGMTEVGPNLTSLHQSDAVRKRGSIGRPNYYVDIRIVDENGQDCPPNEPGELLLRGPMVTPGYWRNREATRKALDGGWFHTGDLVRQDEEQYIYVVDRIKNMFISGGENVYPAEIERVMITHPAVAEASVIPAPDEKWGEVGKAFVVLRPGQSLSEQALLEYCSTRLARFKIPKSVAFISGLPKNDTGKINRQALKAMG
ncbi:MAG: long-chain fatty acid--CoA ligase [Bacteroidetes bacterium]|nr:long-chain fatty acid--CoA ligase [Bacteroidota bacterium]